MSAPAPPLSSVLSGLSAALDLSEGHPRGHAARTSVIAMTIARGLALEGAALFDVFCTALLKDAGSSANASQWCRLLGGPDELLARGAAWRRDRRRLSAKLRYGLEWIEPGGTPAARAGRWLRLARLGRGPWRELARIRSTRGAAAVVAIGLGDAAAEAVGAVDEHWDGGGSPAAIAGDRIPLAARIVGLAQVVEVFCHIAGPARALEVAHERRGRWFDPALVDCFTRVETMEMWGALREDDPSRAVAAIAPRDPIVEATEARLDQVAAAFASIVDAKSVFTVDHSHRVATAATAMAERLAFPAAAVARLRRAAWLHDLGTLGVPSAVLDKPGPLLPDERETARQHAYLTQRILLGVPALADLAEDAAGHHERLDGRGYPRGLRGDALTPTARVLAVAEVADALLSDRPYRAAVPLDRVVTMMAVEAGTTLCADAVGALREVVERDPRQLRAAG